jgi:hypothetical protein
MKIEIERRSGIMSEGEFSSNFMWYEWGFVSPGELGVSPAALTHEAHMAETEVIGYERHAPAYETWDEDNRWMT